MMTIIGFEEIVLCTLGLYHVRSDMYTACRLQHMSCTCGVRLFTVERE